jgi:hypothetical protein
MAQAVTVRKEVIVETSIERAFAVFTDRFGDFKPPAPAGKRSPTASTAPRAGRST